MVLEEDSAGVCMPRAVQKRAWELSMLIIVWYVSGLLGIRRRWFFIKISGDKVAGRGRVPGGFQRECELICLDNAINKGLVMGVRSSGQLRLLFSHTIPRKHRQKFRNALLSVT